jgi:hypothetical protein
MYQSITFAVRFFEGQSKQSASSCILPISSFCEVFRVTCCCLLNRKRSQKLLIMTLTWAEEEDDHGLSVYQNAHTRAQRRLAPFELDHKFPAMEALENENDYQPDEEHFPDTQPGIGVTWAPNSDNVFRPAKTNGNNPQTSYEETRKPPATHSRFEYRVVNEDGELTTTFRTGEDMAAPSSFDDIRTNSTSQNNLLNVKESLRLADDYSEAEVSYAKNRSIRGPPSWASKQRGDGDGGDSSDGVKPAQDPNDEFYDSDLVTEASGEVRIVRVHAKKMRKWRALASGRFESMLLECIVNTGM